MCGSSYASDNGRETPRNLKLSIGSIHSQNALKSNKKGGRSLYDSKQSLIKHSDQGSKKEFAASHRSTFYKNSSVNKSLTAENDQGFMTLQVAANNLRVLHTS